MLHGRARIHSVVEYAAVEDEQQQIRGVCQETRGDGREQPVPIRLLLY